MNEPTPQGPNPPPKMSRDEAEAMIKAMEQELVVQRAKREIEEGQPKSGRWLAFMGVLFLVMAIFLYGVWKTNQVRGESKEFGAPKSKPPTVTPKK